MSVIDRLPGRRSAVHADVDAFVGNGLCNLLDECEDPCPFGGRKKFQACHVDARHNQDMSLGDGKPIGEGRR